MSFETFKTYLTTGHRSSATGRPLGPHAAIDYPSRLRRLESLLGLSIESLPPSLLRTSAAELRHDPRVNATVSAKVIGDIAVAVRA